METHCSLLLATSLDRTNAVNIKVISGSRDWHTLGPFQVTFVSIYRILIHHIRFWPRLFDLASRAIGTRALEVFGKTVAGIKGIVKSGLAQSTGVAFAFLRRSQRKSFHFSTVTFHISVSYQGCVF
jgi:hypothetical protein